jgi:predicted nucleotidyltransferase
MRSRYNEPMKDLARVAQALESWPDVRLAVLFGSTARGTAGRASDLDIGVSVPRAADLVALRVALQRASGQEVDVIRLEEAAPLLRFQIARDARVIVERVAYAWADFRARAMIDWWDWAPTLRAMHRTMAERLREEAGRGSA